MKKTTANSLIDKKQEERMIKELVTQVEADFKKRQEQRLLYERQWELNMNFLSGNQYCDVNARGEILDENKEFYWQRQNVYNHIAPIIDTRLAKFSNVNPSVSVRPKSDDDKDVAAASLAEKLIQSAFKKTDIQQVVRKTTVWSETCGTGFYKVVWDNMGGNRIGQCDQTDVFEGEIKVIPVSPFEIFPDSISNENIEDCESIIHARAMTVSQIQQKYGVSVAGESIDVHSLSAVGSFSNSDGTGILENACIVIERYERPTKEYPQGRLTCVASGKLLYSGELPYQNGENGQRSYPFIKQCSIEQAGCFFGESIIQRLIPIQRAFNAVKNRKHEFLNRLSMGVMTVEDGSVDVDDLAEDGLSPGKVVVYRQGSKAPEMMSGITMPTDFNEEEEKLLNEFVIVSGVSNVTSSSANASVSSGTALEILVEQDNSRLVRCADVIRKCYVDVSKQIIRLYAQFSGQIRAVKYQDETDKTRVTYLDKRAVDSDDVYLENENELLYTNRQKKDMIFQLYQSGLLTDDDGKLRPSTKEKVLSLLGYKDLDYQKGLSRLQEEKAQRENDRLKKQPVEVDEIDDDAIHENEHVRYVLSEYLDLSQEQKERYFAHVKAHRERLKLKEGENDDGTN